MKELIIGDIHIAVEQKPIKNMYLRIHPGDGRVLLSAPKRMPDATIRQFAEQRLPWIQKHLAQSPALRAPHMYEPGETLYLWGEPYLLDVLPSNHSRSHVSVNGRLIVLYTPADSTVQVRQATLARWYREQLSIAISEALPLYEQTVGKKATSWRIRDMKSRWGTCNVKTGAITLNLQLVQRAPECLAYVLVHELTHLYEPGHNARFYSYLDRFYPNWKRVAKQLKQGL